MGLLLSEPSAEHADTGDTVRSDALVFFGATGDLAYKQIFPALQALVRSGELDVPIIGVGRSGWTTDKLIARARASLEANGGVDEAAFEKLARRLCYIAGDYTDPKTYGSVREASATASRPLPVR